MSHVSYCKGITLIAGFAGFAFLVVEDSTSGRRFGVAETGTLLVAGFSPRLWGSSASLGARSVAVGGDVWEGRLRLSVEDAVFGTLDVLGTGLDWIATNEGEYCVLASLVPDWVTVDCDDRGAARGEVATMSRLGRALICSVFGDDLEEGSRRGDPLQ